MQEAIKDMELQREALYKKLQEVGDFRRGIVSANYRKCGKKNCACAKKGHSGHGPQYLWNATIDGKSRAKNLKLGSEVQKYLQDTENYRKFVGLCEEIIQVNGGVRLRIMGFAITLYQESFSFFRVCPPLLSSSRK